MFSFLLPYFLIGVFFCAVMGLFAVPIGQKLKLMDYPEPNGGRKLHECVTPLVGGVGVVGTVILAGGALIAQAPEEPTSKALAWLLVAVTGLFAVGAIDDRISLGAKTRLVVASIIFLAVITQIPDFSISFLLFSGGGELLVLPAAIGIFFTLTCFVGLLNAVNMSDGKNGLVLGQAIIWSAILMCRLPVDMLPLMSAVLGGLVVLFLFNMRGKLFLGDNGSYGLSAFFGLMAIYAWNHGFADMRAEDVALIFAVPVLDTLRLIGFRTAQGKSPFTPGRDHLHHYLYTRWGWPKPLPWILALVAIPNVAAILLPGTAAYWLLFTVFGYLAMLRVATFVQKARVA